MKLISIKLNPFAGLSNYQMNFTEGLNVKCGPNEVGKSTIVNALLMTWFVPTNLTPAALRDAISNYLPKPTGDTIKTKLKFSVNDLVYSVEKSWGGTQSTRLTLPDGSIITDPKTAQSNLLELLELNEATYKNILITNQSQLKESIETLKNNHFVKSTLSDTLRKSIIQQDGVSADTLKTVLLNKVESYFNNWDKITDRPRDNRDLSNRHQKKVGLILKAYYQKREIEELLKAANKFEGELDRIIKEIQSHSKIVSDLSGFLQTTMQAYEDAKMRSSFEGEKFRIDTLFTELNSEFTEWPTIENQVENMAKILPALQAEIKELEEELQLANKIQKANVSKQKYMSAKAAKDEIEKTEKELNSLQSVEEKDLELTKQQEKSINDALIKIKAQEMRLKVTGKRDTSFLIRSGIETETEVAIKRNEEVFFDVNGKVSIENDDLCIAVESLQEDISALEEEIKASRQKLELIYTKYSVTSTEDLKLLKKEYDSKKLQIDTQIRTFEKLLNGEKYDYLLEEYEQINDLPSVRPSDLINKKLVEAKSKEREYLTISETSKKRLDFLIQKHKSKDALQERLLIGLGKRSEVEKKIEGLRPLPEGYESNDAFVQEYDNKSKQIDSLKEELNEMRIRRERLEVNRPSKTVKELTEELLFFEKDFLRKKEEGNAYQTILEKLDTILETINEETYYPLQERVNFYIKKLTNNKYSKVILEGVEPQSLQNHTKLLNLELLSKGTIDIVALALRLGAADFYLKYLDGFLVMDDPLVDLDSKRQTAAAEIIAEFALEKQTIIFTCHDEHAKLLKTDYEVLKESEILANF